MLCVIRESDLSFFSPPLTVEINISQKRHIVNKKVLDNVFIGTYNVFNETWKEDVYGKRRKR